MRRLASWYVTSSNASLGNRVERLGQENKNKWVGATLMLCGLREVLVHGLGSQ